MPKKQKRKNSPSNEASQSNGAPPLKKHTLGNISLISNDKPPTSDIDDKPPTSDIVKTISNKMQSTGPILLSNIPSKAAPHAYFLPHLFNRDSYVTYDNLPVTEQDSEDEDEDENERNQEVTPEQKETVTYTEQKQHFFIETRSRIKNQLIEESKHNDSQETDILSQLARSLDLEKTMLKNKVIHHLKKEKTEIIKFFRNHSETKLRRCNARQFTMQISNLESNCYNNITDILTIYAFQKIYNRPVLHRGDQPVQMEFPSNAKPVFLPSLPPNNTKHISHDGFNRSSSNFKRR